MTRVAVVTGAGGGLGGAAARRLAEEGDQLVLTDVAEDRVKAVADEIVAAGGQAIALAADARLRADVDRVVAAGLAEFGGIDVLLNAAGGSLAQLTGHLDKPVWEHTDDEWRLVVEVNLDGAFHWVRAVSAPMIDRGAGHIILVASGTGLRPGPNMAAYAAAKAGTIGLMKAAARDLGVHGVQVNAVNPGLTPHGGLAIEAAGPNIAGYTADTMLGRLSTPEEFARFVASLSRMTAISGQTVNIDSKILF